MNNFDAGILGAIQGITEFLPISSSGHLIIVEELLKLKVETLLEFDIMMHLGTLFSILFFFRKDIWNLIKLFPHWIVFVYKYIKSGFIYKEARDPELHTITFLLIATIPAGIAGVFFGDLISELFRSSRLVAVMMYFTGILFIIAELVNKMNIRQKSSTIDKVSNSNILRVLFIGLMQALALIPGVSRSGSTISAGLIAGIKREESARFSFLLGSIAIFGASILAIKDFNSINSESSVSSTTLVIGVLSSFIFGLLSIGFLMKFLKNHSLIVFSIYLFIFATINLIFF